MLIKEERSVKARVYRKAAGEIAQLNEDVTELARQDRLSDFGGLGGSIHDIIAEIQREGKSSVYEELCHEYPAALIEWLRIPGVGPKTVRQLYNHLQITTVPELLRAAEAGQLTAVPGIGKKNAAHIERAVREYGQSGSGITLAAGWNCADEIADRLRALKFVAAVTPVGSLRRGREYINDVDILVASRDEAAVRRTLSRYPGFTAVLKDEPGFVQARMEDIPVEIIIVPEEEYAARLLWCTGSKAYRAELFAGREPREFLNCRHEREVYAALGQPYLPPELREQGDESGWAQRWPAGAEPVRQEDLLGDFHVRLSWEQGAEALRELAETARAMGYRYIILTSPAQSWQNWAFSQERWRQLMYEIDELNDGMGGFHIIKGLECNITKSGDLDLDERLAREVDIIVAAVGSHFKLGREEQTRRMINVIEHTPVDMIARLSGRIMKQRSPMDMDYAAVVQAAAARGVILEINSRPECMDMGEELIRLARAGGAKIALGSDAGCAADLKNIRLGLKLARRAGIMSAEVENSLSLIRLRSGAGE